MKRPNCDPASSSLPENCGTLLQTGRLSRRRPALLTLRGRSFGHAVGFRAALFDICLDSIGLIPNRSRKSAKCSCWGYCVKLPGTPCGLRVPSFHFRGAVNHTFTALVFPFSERQHSSLHSFPLGRVHGLKRHTNMDSCPTHPSMPSRRIVCHTAQQ